MKSANPFSRSGAVAAMLALALTLAAPTVASAETYTRREIALLPEYCRYAGGGPDQRNAAQVKRWKAIIGPMFDHIHHYCWGLNDVNHARLFAQSEQDRGHNFASSIEEFQYVINHASDDFVLLPEIYTKQAASYIALGKGPLAVPALQRAIELKRDYWPAYADLSDYYKAGGNFKLARDWLDKGLTIMPGVEALKRRLADLDATDVKRTSAKEHTGEPATTKTPRQAQTGTEKQSAKQ